MKKIEIVITFVLVIGILISGCVQQIEKPAKLEKITLATYAGDTGALVYIAQEQGFFAENRLEVIIKDYEAGKLATDALLADEADISTATESVFVSNVFNNSDLRILGTIATAQINELVARRDHGISKPQDLIGKRIGVTKKSTGEFYLGSFLVLNGLFIGDVEVVDLIPSEIVESISKGEIDAAFTWDPNIYNINNRLRENAISWPGQSGQDFYFILITKEKWIKNNPNVAERFLKAIIQAEEFVKENEEESKNIIRNKFNYDFSYIDYIWPKHNFIVRFPQALIITMEDQARWWIANNLTDKTEVPNYLNYIYLNTLEEIKPEAITIIR